MPLPQALLVPLGKADAQLLGRVVDVMSQTPSSELESSEQPQQTFGRFAVLDVGEFGLFSREEGFERLARVRVGSEVGSDFLPVSGGIVVVAGQIGEAV